MLSDTLRTHPDLEPAGLPEGVSGRASYTLNMTGAAFKRKGWRRGLIIAAALHLGLLGLILLVKSPKPTALAPDHYIVALEPWPMPVASRATAQAQSQTAPIAAGKPVTTHLTDVRPAKTVTTLTPEPIPLPAVTPSPPQVAPQPPATDPQGTVNMPDQRKVMAGLAARNAAAAAIIKHDICVNKRNEGKELDKDCPLTPTRQLALGPPPKVLSDRQKCIAKRHEDWKKYRDGTAAYPGLINMFKGKSDCRKWDE
jgi:hypothetical protein